MYNQEYIVDEIIKQDLIKEHPELKKLIRNTSPHEVRGGIMSVLDKNRRVHRDIKFYENLTKKFEYESYIDEIVVNVRKYIEVADCEVKQHGEVMTPIWLVEDMLNTLPDDVWSNKDLKWLDPCCGVGTFQSIIVQRLMKGLKTQIPNPKKRYKHIIEEMIYVCELQAKNLFAFHYVFDKPDIYELNTFYGSFLTDEFNEHMKNEWNIDKFDIIVGNPPYQYSNNEGKTQPLWHKFVEKSISILNSNGCLNFVHPSGWRNIDGIFSNVKNEIKNRDLIFLSINDEKRGLDVFGAETRFDYYCLINRPYNKKTNILFQDGTNEKIDISKLDFIPNGYFDKIFSLIAKKDEDRIELLHSESNYAHRKTHMSKTKNNQHKYPCIYTINSNSEAKLWYSSINNKGDFGKSKLIWSNGRISSIGSFIDENGEYGLMEYASAIVDNKKNLSKIKKAFDSKEFKFLMEQCSVGQLSINYKVIATFKKDFYKQFLND